MKGSVVSVQRVIPASPAALFAVLADASKHALFDGSGTVQRCKDASGPLTLGSVFRVGMKMGVPYTTTNEVVEFEQDRRIAWQTRMGGPLAKLNGGRTWRYELEAVEGGTRVTETWDVSTDRQGRFLSMGGLPKKTEAAMAASLERLEQLTAPTPG